MTAGRTWRAGGGLRPCAVAETDAGGRTHPEPEHAYRSCFQRDRDRILHCSAFRRLDFKTQVFVPHEHDHFRTRMTHTLEVAQVARDVGRALQLNEDLIEAVALAHDLGHPPFGHAGEQALDERMRPEGGFEHNRQSLRVVDYLEHPYPHFRGLNLTRATRECLARHETRGDSPVSEEFPGDARGPLEGQLVDLADEIAYTAADVEDALAAQGGWIDAGELTAQALWRRAWGRAEAAAPEARDIHKQIRACGELVGVLADDCVAATQRTLDELGVESIEQVRTAGRRCVVLSDELAEELAEMQRFLRRRVYAHPACAENDAAGRRTIAELFDAYVADPALLLERYRRRIGEQSVRRVVCDYVAGMTDRFCRQEHRRIVKDHW